MTEEEELRLDIEHEVAWVKASVWFEHMCGMSLDRLWDLLEVFSHCADLEDKHGQRRARECRKLMIGLSQLG